MEGQVHFRVFTLVARLHVLVSQSIVSRSHNGLEKCILESANATFSSMVGWLSTPNQTVHAKPLRKDAVQCVYLLQEPKVQAIIIRSLFLGVIATTS